MSINNMKQKILPLSLALILALTGCGTNQTNQGSDLTPTSGASQDAPDGSNSIDLGGAGDSFGDDILDDLYSGYFDDTPATSAPTATVTPAADSSGTTTPTETPTASPSASPTESPTSTDDTSSNLSDITIACVSGTPDCYTISGNTITFTSVKEDSVYSISGQLKGNIVIDIGDDYKFDLELHGFSLISETTNPVMILSGDKVTLTAKKDYQNYIYDMRDAIDETDDSLYSGAIYSLVDLKIAGKGALNVVSKNNNGIHTKDDLEVKNLTLNIHCVDNALKGNDSVTIESAVTTLIATRGDGIKTSNSDVSSKGNQRGTVSITGGTHTIYAACDGIDAAYNIVVDDASTVLNIFTDKYSNYSEEVTAVSENMYYIRFTSKSYSYSVKYYNSDADYVWVNASYHSSVSSGRSTYYYYSFPKMSEYSKMQFFIYSSDMTQGQEEEYLVASDYLTPNTGYDTFALTSRGNSLSYSWTNYTTSISDGMGGWGGMGGMDGGNTDKGDYSTKGMKSANEIIISNGSINIKAYDDAIHANSESTLENGETPSGNVTVQNGILALYSNDDGLHADGILTIAGGTVSVTNSYEGLEGNTVKIAGGNISVLASDDGINATATTGTGIEISGGTLYIYCSGDGIDANSRTSYSGIVFSGGNTVVISTSSGNSAIDTEQGYKYTGGNVIAIMPSGGMTSEATHCSNFSSIGTNKTASLSANSYLTVKFGNNEVATIKIPSRLSARVICLGSNSASVSTATSSSVTLDANGVCWH